MYIQKHSFDIISFCNKFVPNATDPKMVMVPGPLKLSCHIEVDNSENREELFWKKCKWTRPSKNADGNNAECTVTATDDTSFKKGYCDSSLKVVDIGMGKDRLECSITLRETKKSDSGAWKCTLTKCRDRKDGGCGKVDDPQSGWSNCTRTFIVNATVHIRAICCVFVSNIPKVQNVSIAPIVSFFRLCHL